MASGVKLSLEGITAAMFRLDEWGRAMRVQGVRALARAGSEVRREVHQYNMQLWGELRNMRPVLLFGPAYKIAESGKGEPVVKVIKMANRQQSRITRKHFDAAKRNIDLLGAWRNTAPTGARLWQNARNTTGRPRLKYGGGRR